MIQEYSRLRWYMVPSCSHLESFGRLCIRRVYVGVPTLIARCLNSSGADIGAKGDD